MKLIYLLLSIVFISCQANGQKSLLESVQTEVEALDYEAILSRSTEQDGVLYVVNFWATWCKPCVAELPEFMDINAEYGNGDEFKMFLVTLDAAKKKDDLVIPFLKKNNILAEVLLLDDVKRMNTWIPLFDENWSGAIPATAFYRNGEKLEFHEGQLTHIELKNIIEKYL